MTENSKYPKVRVTQQAHAHLQKLLPAMKRERSNISMTDLASEAILNIPLPQPENKPRRRVSKVTAPSRAPVVVA